MAMLVLPEVFERTCNRPTQSFGREQIQRLVTTHPGSASWLRFYWDLEWTLQQQGFDYTYDKRLFTTASSTASPAGASAFHADRVPE